MGMIVSQNITGSVMTNFGKETFCYVLLGFGLGVTLLYIIVQLVASTYGKRDRATNMANSVVKEDDKEIELSNDKTR